MKQYSTNERIKSSQFNIAATDNLHQPSQNYVKQIWQIWAYLGAMVMESNLQDKEFHFSIAPGLSKLASSC